MELTRRRIELYNRAYQIKDELNDLMNIQIEHLKEVANLMALTDQIKASGESNPLTLGVLGLKADTLYKEYLENHAKQEALKEEAKAIFEELGLDTDGLDA